MSSGIYDRFKSDVMSGYVDVLSDTIMVALMTDSHSFNATHNLWSDVSSNEIDPAECINYTASGVVLSGNTVTTGSVAKWNSIDVVWSSASLSAYHAVVFDVTNSGSLICSIDFGGLKSVSVEDFKIRWDNTVNAIITAS